MKLSRFSAFPSSAVLATAYLVYHLTVSLSSAFFAFFISCQMIPFLPSESAFPFRQLYQYITLSSLSQVLFSSFYTYSLKSYAYWLSQRQCIRRYTAIIGKDMYTFPACISECIPKCFMSFIVWGERDDMFHLNYKKYITAISCFYRAA